MKTLTITRSELVKIAKESIAEEPELDPGFAAAAMFVAETKPAFLLDEYWLGECGCLIGWVRRAEDFDAYTVEELRVGDHFDALLHDHFGGMRSHYDPAVQVIDE